MKQPSFLGKCLLLSAAGVLVFQNDLTWAQTGGEVSGKEESFSPEKVKSRL